MSCYFRHMKDILGEAGVEVTKENKKEIDKILHAIVDVEYKNCPSSWKEIKARIKEDKGSRNRFIKKIKEALSQ